MSTANSREPRIRSVLFTEKNVDVMSAEPDMRVKVTRHGNRHQQRPETVLLLRGDAQCLFAERQTSFHHTKNQHRHGCRIATRIGAAAEVMVRCRVAQA